MFASERAPSTFAWNAVAMGFLVSLAIGQGSPPSSTQETVPALLSQLRDQDAAVRIAAIGRLGVLHDPRAVGPLIDILLADKNPEVRRNAAYALGLLRDRRAIQPLIASLKDESPEVCVNAVFALVQAGKGDGNRLEALTAALAHQDLHVCRAAAVGLALMADTQAVDPLIQALKDQRLTVRSGAAFTLGFLSDRRAVPALLETLQDHRPVVRAAVIGSLGLLGDRRALPALKRLAAHDRDPEVRRHAREVVGKLIRPQEN